MSGSDKKADGAKEVRNKILKIRLTDPEFEDLKQAAKQSDLSMSEHGRSKIFGDEPRRERRRRFLYHPVDPALIRHVAAVGNNLNQLAAWANTHKKGTDTAAVIIRLIALERGLIDLVASQTHEEPPDAD